MRRRAPLALRPAAWALLVFTLGGWARCGDPQPIDTYPTGPWQLAWSDDFEGAAGTSPDPARWGFDVGTGTNGWGNGQLEYDTARPENAALDGEGNLAIVARRESYGGSAYTSARLNTRGTFSQAYGKFEARMKLPAGRGVWPAFWLLGANFGQVGWPACGEIDVMEYLGQEPSRVHGTVHGPGYSGGAAVGAPFDLAGARFDQDFHVFAAEWDPGRIVFSVDGAPYFTVTPASLPQGTRWVFDHPFFVILNLAVGGGWPGPPDASTVFPQTLLVDWVRVHERGP
jgi:beta-glucanase (GH16 family)